jgi:hypothetical protein
MKYETKVIESIDDNLDFKKLSIDNSGFQYGKNVMTFQKKDGSVYVVTVNQLKGPIRK